MRFTEINEGMMDRKYSDTRRQPLEHTQAFEFIRDHCMNAYDGDPIFRGAKRRNASEGAMIVDTSTAVPRESANTKSYVGILMDTLQDWQAYPKRSKSLICTNRQSDAQAYGVLYRVFPMDGTKIGVCGDSDVWGSFNNFHVPQLNSALDEFSRYFLHQELSETPTEFYKQLDLISEHVDAIDGYDNIPKDAFETQWFLRLLSKSSELLMTTNLREILRVLTNPKANGFTLSSIDNLSLSEDHELWFEGKAVLLPKPLWSQLEAFLWLKPSDITTR